MTNDEKLDLILEILNQHTGILNQHTEALNEHTEILNQHTETLSEHTRTLREHTALLNEHTAILSEHTQLLNQHTKTLKEHGKVLNRHSGELKDIRLAIENEIHENIRRIAEGHLDLSRNLHEAMKPSNELEMITIRVGKLETDVRMLQQKIS